MHISINYKKEKILIQRPRICRCRRMNNYLAKYKHVGLGYLWYRPWFVCEVTFKLFFLTDVNNHCEEQKIKLLINNNTKNIKKLT